MGSRTDDDSPDDASGDDVSPGDASGDGATVQTPGRMSGRRVVLVIYVASIATAASFGVVLGYMLDVQNGPETAVFGPVTFPITPLTLAVFGAVTVGCVLALGLLLVSLVAGLEE